MGSHECSWGNVKKDSGDSLDVRSDRAGDEEEREGADKRRHRSSKSRKPSSGDGGEGLESSWKRKSSGDRSGSRRRSGGQVESDDDDYESRKDARAKQIKKKQEVSSLEKLSNWYEDGDLESRPNGREKLDSRVHARAEESEKRQNTSKSDQEGLRTGTKSREGRSSDGELERRQDSDFMYSERWDSSQDKDHGSSDQVRNSRRRWDESDSVKKAEETHYKRADMRNSGDFDCKYEGAKERNASLRIEPDESRNKGSESNVQSKIIKEEKKDDAERNKSKGRSEGAEDDKRDSPNICEDGSTRERSEKHRHQRNPGSCDVADENGITWNRERSLIEVGGQGNSSGTPERIVRRLQDSENSEIENDKDSDLKRKELDKEFYRDDGLKSKDDSWSGSSMEREGYRENCKRRQHGSSDNDLKGGDVTYERGHEWEIQRHGRERIESERHHGRSGHRKDANRGEAVKTSSNYGISNDFYDVIEIQTRSFDQARAGSASNFSRRSESVQQYNGKSLRNDASVDEVMDRDMGDSTPPHDQSDCRDGNDVQGDKGVFKKGVVGSHSAGGQTSSGSQLPYGKLDPGPLARAPQGVKGSRGGRGGRLRLIGRDNQQAGFPLPMMGSPFGPLGISPPVPMQPLNPNMTPAPGPPISPGVFIPPFSPPLVWPGARGVDMNLLSAPSGLSPGPSGPRFPSNLGTPPNPALYFNQSGPGRGTPPNTSAPNFCGLGPAGQGAPHDKASGGWVAPRSSGCSGKAPSRGEQNDYSQNFVDTGLRPQNFIRELELTNVEDYPKLRELIHKKDEIVVNSSSPPMYFKCNLKEFELSPEFFGTKFDVILVDPPWEEYVHRAPGVADHMIHWTFEEIMNLKLEAIADTPSFIFLWVGDGVGLEQGRQCLKKWGFRRCEDICWVKTNKSNATLGLRHDSHTLLQHSKEHCLMGIKGTVRRSTDGHIIHANIDTDVIIAEEPPYGSTRKPEDMYRIIEHFALGRRRLELFGEDHNIRAGWLTVGKGLSSSNFNAEGYTKKFADKDGKVWQGGGGRNPPPDAPHLVLTTPDIEALRPKSPMKNQQQLQQQQQSNTISLTGPSSSNKRAAGTSPNPPGFILNQEPVGGFKGREGSNMPSEDKVFDMYGYGGQANVDCLNHRGR